MDLNVKVAVRCRPMSSKELNKGSISVVKMIDKTVHISNPDELNPAKDFTFDHCYFTDSTQVEVYADIGNHNFFYKCRLVILLKLGLVANCELERSDSLNNI